MKQQQRSEETRMRILRASRECFAKHGYDATGVAEICNSAELSKGAFYHHFASKQEVFLELLNRWLLDMSTQLTHLREGTTSVPDGLLSMAKVIGDILQAAGQGFPIYLEFINKATRDPKVLEATIEPYNLYREYFRDMVSAGISEGTIKDVQPDDAARVIVALAVGLIFQGLLDPNELDWERVTQEAIKILLEGLIERE